MNNPIVLGHHHYLVLSIFLSNCSHSNGCVVQSHCGFNLHLLKAKDTKPLVMYLSSLYYFMVQCYFKASTTTSLLNHVCFFLIIKM